MGATKIVQLTRNHEDLKFQGVYDAPLLLPTSNSCKADLLLKVTDEGSTKAYIPLHLEMIKKNIPLFEGMLRKNTSFRESSGGPVELKYPHDPQHLCDYFKSVYDSKIALDTTNSVGYHWIANYFNDEQVLEASRSYITENIDEDILFDVLDKCVDFEDACVDYVEQNGIKDPDSLVKKIGRLTRTKLTGFIKRVTDFLPSDVIIKLEKNWLIENYSDDNLKELIFETDFSKISMNDKFAYYNDVIQNMKPEMIIQVHNHIFEVCGDTLDCAVKETQMVKMLKYLEPTETQIQKVNQKCGENDESILAAMHSYQAILVKEAAEKKIKQEREGDADLGKFISRGQAMNSYNDHRTIQNNSDLHNNAYSAAVGKHIKKQRWTVKVDQDLLQRVENNDFFEQLCQNYQDSKSIPKYKTPYTFIRFTM